MLSTAQKAFQQEMVSSQPQDSKGHMDKRTSQTREDARLPKQQALQMNVSADELNVL